jgi:hypothetical protein
MGGAGQPVPTVYKVPIDPKDVDAIRDYLVSIKGVK